MHTIARIIAVLAALMAFGVHAQTLYIHGLTDHYVDCFDPCVEVNPGLSYKTAGGSWWHVGAFENSQGNPSAFAARGVSRRWLGVEWGAGAGVAIGYVDEIGVTEAGLAPVALLSAEKGPVYLAIIPGAVTFAVRVD